MDRNMKVGIYMVATNKYISLWENVVNQLSSLLSNNRDFDITIMLATDQVITANKIAKSFKKLNFVLDEIPPYGWPEATLLRYEFILHFNNFEEFDLCMYLDSDMVFHHLFFREVSGELSNHTIGVVRHPGFALYLNPLGLFRGLTDRKIVRTLLLNIFKQPLRLGTWETNKLSTSYVSPFSRRAYVHGAIWFGKPKGFEQLCMVLSKNVQEDLKNGIIALWHDESHLNWFVSKNRVAILDSKYSWVRNYRNISHFTPFVSSHIKDSTFR